MITQSELLTIFYYQPTTGNLIGNFVEYHNAVNARKNAEVLYGFHGNHGKDM